MDVPTRAAAAISRMEQTRREMAERRALRHRNGMAIREKSRDSLKKHGLAITKAVADMRETAQRQQAAGGWATATVDRGKSHVMTLGLPDDEPATEQPAAERPTPAPAQRGHPPAERNRRTRRQALDDEEDFSNQSSWMTNR